MSISEAFFRGDYMPHGHCYLWQPHILWTNVLSDALIAFSYFSIPVALLVFANKRRDIQFRAGLVLFSAFILLCGVSHLLGIVTIWQGIYGWHGLAKASTAVVSLVTAIYVYRWIPLAIAIPTPAAYQKVTTQLGEAQVRSDELEQQLQESSMFRGIAEAIPHGMLLLDSDMQIIMLNAYFSNKHGFTLAECKGHSVFDYLPLGADQDKLQAAISDCSTPSDAELQFSTFDGTTLPIALKVSKVIFEQKTFFLLLLTDLSEKLLIEQNIVKSEQRFNRIVDATNEGIWEWNVKNDEVWYSPKLMSMIGYDKAASPSLQKWLEHIHPEHLTHIKQALDSHFTENTAFEVEYLGLDDEKQFSWFYSKGQVIFDHKRRPSIMSGSLTNIQSRKTVELALKQTNQQLNESNLALEQFAMVASHDMQEPVRKLMAFSDSLLKRLGDQQLDEDSSFELSRINDSAKRLRAMIKDLLSIARVNSQPLVTKKVSLVYLVDIVKENLEVLIEENQAQVICEGDIEIEVDEPLFVQLLQNLIQNAIKYRDPDRSPEVSIKGERFISHEQHRIAIYIKDNGRGVEEKYLKTIFTPFKRGAATKSSAGNGMGLAISQQIVKVHGGSIICTSQPEVGSEFTVILKE